jgi:imidazolonepropionase-like amidohydrolase
MRDSGVALTPTLAVYSAIPLMLNDAGTRSLLGRPGVKYIDKNVRAKWITEQTNNYKRRFGPERIQYLKDNLAFLERFTAGLHDNGVTILLGSDTAEDQSFMVPGFSIHDELRELVTAGLTPFEALQAGTINAARALNAEREFGTIGVGKQADLVLLMGDPLKDVANIRRVSGVMVRGTWLPQSAIQKKLRQLAVTSLR